MAIKICPLCKNRISDWMIVNGKTESINGFVFHRACALDFGLKHGDEYMIRLLRYLEELCAPS